MDPDIISINWFSQTDFNDIRNLVHDGLVTDPDGGFFGVAGFIVNCPIVSMDGNQP